MGVCGTAVATAVAPVVPRLCAGFDRDLEQSVAGAIAVDPAVDVVVSEGNYLLLDEPRWREVRSMLDVVWFVLTDEPLRRQRLVARHIAFGKSEQQAEAWVARVDEPNARLVETTRPYADLVIDLSAWDPRGRTMP